MTDEELDKWTEKLKNEKNVKKRHKRFLESEPQVMPPPPATVSP